MASLAYLTLLKDGFLVCPFKKLSVWHLILSSDIKNLVKAFCVEVIKLTWVSTVHSPCFAGVQKCGHYHNFETLECCGCCDSSTLSYSRVKSTIC